MKPRSLRQKKLNKSNKAYVKFKARAGSGIKNSDARIIGKRIQEIAKGNINQEIKPAQIVEDAKKENSPLHKYFEWDDAIAAEKYRIQRARQLIGAIQEIVITGGKEKEFRSFISVKMNNNEQAYVPLMVVVEEPDYLDQTIKQAQDELLRLHGLLSILTEWLKKGNKNGR